MCLKIGAFCSLWCWPAGGAFLNSRAVIGGRAPPFFSPVDARNRRNSAGMRGTFREPLGSTTDLVFNRLQLRDSAIISFLQQNCFPPERTVTLARICTSFFILNINNFCGCVAHVIRYFANSCQSRERIFLQCLENCCISPLGPWKTGVNCEIGDG